MCIPFSITIWARMYTIGNMTRLMSIHAPTSKLSTKAGRRVGTLSVEADGLNQLNGIFLALRTRP